MFTFLVIAAAVLIAWAAVVALVIAVVAGGRINWHMETTAADLAALPTTKDRK